MSLIGLIYQYHSTRMVLYNYNGHHCTAGETLDSPFIVVYQAEHSYLLAEEILRIHRRLNDGLPQIDHESFHRSLTSEYFDKNQILLVE